MRTSWSGAEPLREEPLGKSRWERAVGEERLDPLLEKKMASGAWRVRRGAGGEASAPMC